MTTPNDLSTPRGGQRSRAGADQRRGVRRPGPRSWDGYAATVVCDATLPARNTGDRVEASMREQPDLYRPTAGAGPTGAY